MTTPLQVASDVVVVGAMVLVVVLVAVLLWRRGEDVGAGPDVLELNDGTRLSPGEREAVTAARGYVVDEGQVTVHELQSQVYPDHRVGYRTAEDWWRGLVGPTLHQVTEVEVPHVDGEVAPSGALRAEDVQRASLTWIPDASPPEGERFGHAREPGRGENPRVRVSDGQNEAVLRVRNPEDLRVTSWQGGDVDVDWLADAREYLRETVQAGGLDGGPGEEVRGGGTRGSDGTRGDEDETRDDEDGTPPTDEADHREDEPARER